uniref:Secreted protein n=1 Tax=Heterorhabditis bacteriophora TaxID=37862 RepID=A0A1I7WIF2_HETBA
MNFSTCFIYLFILLPIEHFACERYSENNSGSTITAICTLEGILVVYVANCCLRPFQRYLISNKETITILQSPIEMFEGGVSQSPSKLDANFKTWLLGQTRLVNSSPSAVHLTDINVTKIMQIECSAGFQGRGRERRRSAHPLTPACCRAKPPFDGSNPMRGKKRRKSDGYFTFV